MDDSPQNQPKDDAAPGETTPGDTATDAAAEDAATAETSPATDEPNATEETAAEVDPLEVARTDAADWKDRALRAQAELENFRRRSARDSQETIRFANARLLEDLLPVLDNFQLGMMAAKQDESSMIYQGMAMVSRQLDDFLERNGVTEVAAEGEFDPSRHEAMEQQPHDEVAEGQIVRVLRRGFVLKERLLRPASVVVSSGPATD